jgi:hypothetical protein
MNPPGSDSSSSVQAPARIPLFSLQSHLAASDPAKAFIQRRLAGWELEQASLRVLAETTCEHFCGQLRMNRIDLDRAMEGDFKQLRSRIADVCSASCDAIYDGGFEVWAGDPQDGSGPAITSLLAPITEHGLAGSAPSKLLQFMKSLDETGAGWTGLQNPA